MPSRKVWKGGEETSWQRYKTGPACPWDLTREKNAPRLPKSVYGQGRELRKRDLRMAGAPSESEQKPPPAEPPSLAGCWLTARFESEGGSQRDFGQANILYHRPDNGQTTRLCGESVDLIGALAHITEQTLDGIGRLDVPMHALRELVKREGLLFLLSQASHRFWIALAVFGFESRQMCGDRLLLTRQLKQRLLYL